jgi:hypothetical protein
MSLRCADEEYSCSRTGSPFRGPVFLLAVKRRPGLKRLLKKCLAKQKAYLSG